MTIRHDALVLPICVHDLTNVLRYEVGFQAVSSHVGEGVGENLHAVERGKFVNQEQQLVTVQLLLCSFEYHPLGQAIDDHREHQPDERPQANLVGRRDDEVQRDRTAVIDEIGYGEIAGGRILGNQGIAEQRKRCFGRAEDAAKIPLLFVEHLLCLLPDHGVRRGPLPGGHVPTMLVSGIVRKVEQFGEGIAEVRVSQPRAKKMQSQMQSQAKSNLTMRSNLLKIMVSRAGLEPATTALKVRCSTN